MSFDLEDVPKAHDTLNSVDTYAQSAEIALMTNLYKDKSAESQGARSRRSYLMIQSSACAFLHPLHLDVSKSLSGAYRRR